MRVLNKVSDQPMQIEERAAMPLAGGIAMYGYQCGMVWGAALAAGAQAYRLYSPGPQAEAGALRAAQRTTASFRAAEGTLNCGEITGLDKSASMQQMMAFFFLKGGAIHCFRMSARYARLAWGELKAAFAVPSDPPPPADTICTALLARQMGASDVHAAMAAGLAGGIGLSGGVCGALGAAIWLDGIHTLQAGSKISIDGAGVIATVERFKKLTDGQVTCAQIAGKTFAGVDDHTRYVRDGGCAKLIQDLAARS